jgi:signal transduction histidine kinase
MKLRTQLVITMVVFGLALLIIAASVITTNQQVDRLNNQKALATNIELQAGELNYLSDDYLLYNEGLQVDTWNSKYSSISDEISNLSVDRPDQQVLVNQLKDNQQQLKNVFDDVVARVATETLSQNNTFDKAFIQVSWNRIGVQTQGLIFDTSLLSQKLGDESNQQNQINYLLISALLGVFVVFLLTNYFLIYRNTIKKISTLQDGTRIIGAGDLDFSIEEKNGDEFYDLSHAFNQMTTKLKTITASRADLEKEVAERKLAEMELQHKQEELEAQAEELKAQAEELSANNDQLEKEIKERRRAEDALLEAKMQAEMYLDLMGHDISNMHQIAIGQLELGQDIFNTDGKLEGENKSIIDISLQSLWRSAKLIDNVRKLQKIRSNDVKNIDISLDDMLAGSIMQYDGLYPDKSIKVYYGEGPHIVKANDLLRDVFTNLIGNAIKHSNGSKVDISVKLDDVLDNGKKYYKVSIEDDGPGIPDDMKENIFNRLQRGETKARGMGLGLYLVRSLVESYNGKVWVENRVHGDHTKGSRFVVILPAIEI